MYKRIRRFVHHNYYNSLIVIRYGDGIISSPPIVAYALGSAFASHSREFSKEFYKAREFEGRIDFSVWNKTPGNFDYPYNKLFTLDEFKAVLSFFLPVESAHRTLMEFFIQCSVISILQFLFFFLIYIDWYLSEEPSRHYGESLL